MPEGRRVFGELSGDEGFLTTDANPVAPTTLAFHGSTGDLVCRWRPTEAGKPEVEITYAAVVGKGRVVTLDRAGRLVGWQIPQCRAEWTLELPEATRATLSPKGDRLAVASAKGIHIVDAESGNGLGLLAGDPQEGSFSGAIAIRADGMQVVAGRAGGVGNRYRVWNLSGERSAKSFTAPSGGGLIHLGGDLIFNGLQAIDVRRELVVWQCTDFQTGRAASQPSDGRIWHLATQAQGLIYGVQALRFPRVGVEGLLDDMEQSKDQLMRPGDRVRLEVDFPGAPDRYRQAATQAALGRLEARNIIVAEDAPLTLVLRAVVVPTGETVNLSWQDLKKLGQQETLKPYSVRCTAELRPDGRPIVAGPPREVKMDLGRTYQTIVITDDSKTAKEFFERQVWNQVVGWAAFAVPAGPTATTVGGQAVTLPLTGRVKGETLQIDWPFGYTPQAEPAEPIDGAPLPDAAAKRPKWVWIAGGCGTAVVLFAVAAISLLLRRARRKPAVPPTRKRPPILKPSRRPTLDPDDE